MEQEHSENNTDFPQHLLEGSESLPKDSEGVGSVSEDASDTPPKFRNFSERIEDHTITVREAAKIFEEANVPVTERTIINWCKANKRGIVRLDCYYDEGDGKYFMTPQSIEQIIKEEAPRGSGGQDIHMHFSESREEISEPVRKASEEQPKVAEEVPKDAETGSESFCKNADQPAGRLSDKDAEVRKLRQQLMDEKILNKGKDFFIEQLQKDRETFAHEREQLIHQMILQGERVGRLETELRQLQAPRQSSEANDQTANQIKYDEEESPQVRVPADEDEQGRPKNY